MPTTTTIFPCEGDKKFPTSSSSEGVERTMTQGNKKGETKKNDKEERRAFVLFRYWHDTRASPILFLKKNSKNNYSQHDEKRVKKNWEVEHISVTLNTKKKFLLRQDFI